MRPAIIFTAITIGGVIFSGHGKRLSTTFSMSETKRYLFFFFIMILGIPFAYHRGIAFDVTFLNYVMNIVFFLILVSEIDSLKRLKSLIWTICFCTFMYSFFGYFYGSTYKGGRLQSVGYALDPNDTAFILISLFPLCLFYLLFNEGVFKRLFCLVAICSSVAVILLTGSRGGLLGLITVLTILLLTKIGGIKKSHKILFLVVIGGISFLMADKIDLERYMTLTDLESDYNMTGEEGRWKIWERGMTIAFDHPVIGVGVGCFPMAIGTMRFQEGLPLVKWNVAHNSYIEIAAEMGLVAFVIFIVMNVQSLLTFLRINRVEAISPNEAHELRALGGLMLLGFTGQLVTAFFLSQAYSYFFTLYFALATIIRRLEPKFMGGGGSDKTRVRIGA
jgi:O-antigen ligase